MTEEAAGLESIKKNPFDWQENVCKGQSNFSNSRTACTAIAIVVCYRVLCLEDDQKVRTSINWEKAIRQGGEMWAKTRTTDDFLHATEVFKVESFRTLLNDITIVHEDAREHGEGTPLSVSIDTMGLLRDSPTPLAAILCNGYLTISLFIDRDDRWWLFDSHGQHATLYRFERADFVTDCLNRNFANNYSITIFAPKNNLEL